MPTLVFRLRNVPEDEADDVRALMDENEFDWYETSAGNWGIAMPGIWVSNDQDLQTARQLIETYQRTRQSTMRESYHQEVDAGNASSFVQRLKEHPLRVVGLVLFCLFILFVSINPFMQLIGYKP
ncbi:MAG: hypothetical protein ACI8VW_003625 [bacterium]|jgi:hypothetical protein